MASDAAAIHQQSHVQWLWKATTNSYSELKSDEWCPYSDVETHIIEEAYEKKQAEVLLDNYHINFKHFIQICNNNQNNQRPVKRINHGREETKLRNERFLPNPISPLTPFTDLDAGNFVKAVRDHLHLNNLHLSDDAERQLLVEKAAEGLIIEGKKIGQQKEAEWLAQRLLNVRSGTRQEVWECCARLYCMESFLYMKMNEWMRLVDEEEQETIWKNKVPTFGPFACLFYIPSGRDRKKILHVYRGAQLSDQLIQCYCEKSLQPNEQFMFPAFTSTSRNQKKAEQFGNVLLVIEVSDYDSYDVSSYSSYDEEEQLIKPSFTFYIRSCKFDEQKRKWIIHLKSFLSS